MTGGAMTLAAAVSLLVALLPIPRHVPPAPPGISAPGIAISGTLAETLVNSDQYQIQGSIAFSPDSAYIAAASADSKFTTGHVYRWKVPGPELAQGQTAPGEDNPPNGVAFGKTSNSIAVADDNGIGLWNWSPRPPRIISKASPGTEHIEAVSYSPALGHPRRGR
jgi:hypothetical protein